MLHYVIFQLARFKRILHLNHVFVHMFEKYVNLRGPVDYRPTHIHDHEFMFLVCVEGGGGGGDNYPPFIYK
jgi:hypothetical protein